MKQKGIEGNRVRETVRCRSMKKFLLTSPDFECRRSLFKGAVIRFLFLINFEQVTRGPDRSYSPSFFN